MVAKIGLLLALVSPQAQTAKPNVTANGLISKAMSRYYDAKTLSGTIQLVQEAKGVSVGISTQIQFDQPSNIYIHQERGGSQPEQYTLVSDGKRFSYDRPGQSLGPRRFVEDVTQHGYRQSFREMYAASVRSILDRSPALDLVIARREDLEALRQRIGARDVSGTVNVGNGKTAYVVTCNWHDIPGEDATGKIQFVIGAEGDLYQVVRTQRYRVADKMAETITITSTWNVNVSVNAATNANLYRVPKAG